MKISVTAKTRSKNPGVEEVERGVFKVSVQEPPTNGRANEAIIKAVANHLEVAPSQVSILKGSTSSRKIVEVRQ